MSDYMVNVSLRDLKAGDLDSKYDVEVVLSDGSSERQSYGEWRKHLEGQNESGYHQLLADINDEISKAERIRSKAQSAKVDPKVDAINIRNQSVPSRLVEIAHQNGKATFFKDGRGDAYARTWISDHFEIVRLDDSDYKAWLSNEFYGLAGDVPSNESISAAMRVLTGEAKHNGRTYDLELRTAQKDGAFWYNLADSSRRAVRVDEKGWQIIDEPPILFRHLSHMKPQDEPTKGRKGALDEFLTLANLQGNDLMMFKILLVTDLIPGLSHPGVTISGQQGSAKSMTVRLEKMLIDPSEIPLTRLVKDESEVIRVLDRHHIVCFDNVRDVRDTVSDLLAQATTGAGVAVRRKYTDDEDFVRRFRRIIRLNGVYSDIKESDLLSRMILFELAPIPKESRKMEADIWAEFYRLRPYVLGELFDILSKTMAIRKDLPQRPAPRLADWYAWGRAAMMAFGKKDEDFIDLFQAYEDKQNDEAVDQNLIAQVIIDYVRFNDRITLARMTDLEESIRNFAVDTHHDTRSRDWPNGPSAFSKKFRFLAEDLRKRGIGIKIDIRWQEVPIEVKKKASAGILGQYSSKDRIVAIGPVEAFEIWNGDGTGKGVFHCPVPASQIVDGNGKQHFFTSIRGDA